MNSLLSVEVINTSNNALPMYATPHSAGLDLRANLTETVVLEPNQRFLVPTGLFMAIPEGFEGQVRPRSGLALKHGITVLNSPGTIDADYRGEVKVLLINLGTEPFSITNGERVAQLIISKYYPLAWQEVSELSSTERGTGGYGSTGKS